MKIIATPELARFCDKCRPGSPTMSAENVRTTRPHPRLSTRLAKPAICRRPGRGFLAKGIWRARPFGTRAADLARRICPRGRTAIRHDVRRAQPRRADPYRPGRRRRKGPPLPHDPAGQGELVPGLLRTGRRVRSCQSQMPGRDRRRSPGRQRHQDLDHLRPSRPLAGIAACGPIRSCPGTRGSAG